jgi:hypothetical protein
MGMVLTCPRDALPGEAAAFLILTYELEVSAVSEAGEKVFGREQGLIGAQLLDLLTSPMGDDQLVRHANAAAQRPSPRGRGWWAPWPRESPPAARLEPRCSRSSQATSVAARREPEAVQELRRACAGEPNLHQDSAASADNFCMGFVCAWLDMEET